MRRLVEHWRSFEGTTEFVKGLHAAAKDLGKSLAEYHAEIRELGERLQHAAEPTERETQEVRSFQRKDVQGRLVTDGQAIPAYQLAQHDRWLFNAVTYLVANLPPAGTKLEKGAGDAESAD